MTSDLLAQKEKQLALLLALDSTRDTADMTQNPDGMFRGILYLLKEQFQAEACGLLLLNEAGDAIEVVLSIGASENEANMLCRQAMMLEAPDSLLDTRWKHTLGIPIVLVKPLGGIFLARSSETFDADEIELLKIAESQIDSAVMQARMIWSISQRNIELETIYQIDRMKDDNPDEDHLIGRFVGLNVDRLKAELCMLLLSHIDSGEILLRGMVDKNDLPTETLEKIKQLTAQITTTQMLGTAPDREWLHLMAAPFIIGGERLGTVIVGRKKAFSLADQRLLFAMTSQMDSAIAHSRTLQQLVQRSKELETIYEVDRIRDRGGDFNQMLHLVLIELCKAVTSEAGYLMLYEESGEERLELKASTRESLLTSADYLKTIKQVSLEALTVGKTIHQTHKEGAVRSIIAIPLILNEKIIGVFGVVNSFSVNGFSSEDRRILTAITSQVDTAVFEQLERRRMRKVLGRSVDPKVLELLLQRADSNMLAGERVILSTLFADLRGSTEWAEQIGPEELVSSLNIFLGSMTNVIFKHGGTLDKFVGDQVIALFGSPIRMEDHAIHAAQAAVEMQIVHANIQAELKAQGKHLPDMGIGVSSGEVIAGEFGPPIRTDFTAMGRIMNLGARLCSAASAEQIIIDQMTRDMIEGHAQVHPLEPVTLKGIGSVPIFELLGLK